MRFWDVFLEISGVVFENVVKHRLIQIGNGDLLVIGKNDDQVAFFSDQGLNVFPACGYERGYA